MGGNRVIWEIVVDIAKYYIGMKVGTFCGDGFWSLSREILVFCFCLNPRPVIIVCQRKARRLVGWSGLVANIKVDCTM